MIVDLVKHAVAQPTFVIHGVRKIIQGVFWEEPKMPPALDILKDLGGATTKGAAPAVPGEAPKKEMTPEEKANDDLLKSFGGK